MRYIFSFILISSFLFGNDESLTYKLGLRNLTSVKDIEEFFPKTVKEVEDKKTNFILGLKEVVEKICTEEAPDFERVGNLFDLLFGSGNFGQGYFTAVGFVHPNKEIRLAAEEATTEITKSFLAELNAHPELYKVISKISLKKLSEEQVYFITEIKNELKRMGLNLSQEKRNQAQALQEEIANLSEQFMRNITESRKSLFVTLAELEGMEESFIKSLKRKDELYELTTDYFIAKPVLNLCRVEATRKKIHILFNNRADKNLDILPAITLKREQLAQLLGYDSYAKMQLESEMVKTPQKAKKFLDDMTNILKDKQKEEFNYLKDHKPQEVTLTEDGKFNPWDFSYVLNKVKTKQFAIDIEALKVYFSLENTLSGLIEIYEKFFSLKIEEIPSSNLWHKDVRLMRISNTQKDLVYGHIILDPFPRDGKRNHPCDVPVLPSLKTNAHCSTALSVVICSFPLSTDELPSLLRPIDLSTFFHEFGHALHDMLGRTELISAAGTSTKRDFVEMPSQILEEWLKDPKILQMCSKHYETQEKLPLETIEKMIAYNNSFQAQFWMRQLMLANFSLSVYQSPSQDLGKLWSYQKSEYCIESKPLDQDLYYLVFGHLNGYGARYYGYLWSKVYALDIFEKIKKEGLLNPLIGKEYTRHILSKGGSLDPNQYLIDFLGREPNIEAFNKSIR